jgi:dTDP-4-dehydrorhamnose 3,5-epimerase
MKPLEIPYQPLPEIKLPEYISLASLPGIVTIQRPVFADDRGDFWEIGRIPDLEKTLGRDFKIQQINRSRNIKKGSLRGIHVADWDKLIFIVKGAAFIALIDLRKNSPTFGKVYTEIIGDGHKTMSILVPSGFGNSYQAVTDNTDYMYAVTDLWSPGREIGIRWNDPTLNINWPISTPILSPKDEKNPLITEYIPEFEKLKK